MNRFFQWHRRFAVLLLGFAAYAVSGAPLNVRDFGAKGDGSSDDTAAIQQALNAMEKERKAQEALYVNDDGRISGWGVYDGPNRELLFPAGEYKVTRTLVGGKGVTLSGEKGSVIFTENADMPLFYFERLFRGSFRNLTFRGGRHQLLYWSANQDTTSFVAENCRFENSSDYAITTRTYARLEKAANDSDWDRMTWVGPYDVSWDEQGMPTLHDSQWDCGGPNSTKNVIHHCEFIDCAGASDVASDGAFVGNCRFVSELPQRVSPFVSCMSGCIYDTEITAAIPEDFTGAFVENYGAVIDVDARSTTRYGAPLYQYDKKFRKELTWSFPESILIENCTVDAAPSPVDAIARFPRARPVQFTLRNTHERNGRPVRAMHFDLVPTSDEELMEDSYAAANVPQVPVACSHAYSFSDNGTEISTELPEIMRQFVKPDLSEAVRNSFPALGSRVAPIDPTGCEVFDAADYGIRQEAAETDYENLQKLFDQAATARNPLIRLPGRRFDLPGPLTIPARAVIRAEGRTFFHAEKLTDKIFQVDGEALALELTGLTFDCGAVAVDISGAGTVRIDDCIFYDNRVAVVCRKSSERPLIVDLYAITTYAPEVLENHGAEVRIDDSWISIQATLKEGAALRNLDDGTLLIRNICGVPVVFSDWPDRPNWPYGFQLYWIENHGVYRSMFFRYGGEFGGIPVLDNYGAGKACIEGNNAHFYHAKSDKTFLRNESADATVAVGTVSSFWNSVPAADRAFCTGVAPKQLYVANFPEPNGLQLRDQAGNQKEISTR